MSDILTIQSAIHNYSVKFVNDFSPFLKEHFNMGDILVVDKNVLNLYQSMLFPFLNDQNYIAIEATEQQKSYEGVSPVIKQLIDKNFKKNNKLIALGGGITQDISAFVASNIYRGVPWIFYPTTLLAQCDSCIGGKSSINFSNYKNQLGNFYPPVEIIIDSGFLKTLSELDIRSGLGEMMHFYLVSSENDFQIIKKAYHSSMNDEKVMKSLIARSLEIKKETIEIDEFDKNERQIFNYGHSFGHAIETLTNYRIPHGIAVCYGMDIANFISERLGLISNNTRFKIRGLLSQNWEKGELGDIDLNKYIDALKKDKKNVGTEVRVILTKGIGKMFKMAIDINGDVSLWLKQYFDQELMNNYNDA